MSRQQVITTAAAEDGITESPAGSNQNKYGAWYGLNGVRWCAIFVSWVFDKAGHPLGKIDTPKGFQYCPSAYNFWKRNNRLTTTPQMGDIVLFDWEGDGICNHTGIFVSWIKQGDTFQSWEGNTSFGSDSNGGRVMLRQRSVQLVKAFVDPGVFADSAIASPDESVRRGDKGTRVTQIQKWLYQLGYTITVDGDFGEKTEKIVREFQKKYSLASDGVVDIITHGVMEGEVSKPRIPEKKLITGAFLKNGDAGVAVVALQKGLNKKGAKLEEDGMFGKATTDALKAFQKKNKLKVDGIAGPQVFKALSIKP